MEPKFDNLDFDNDFELDKEKYMIIYDEGLKC